jgi:hypothetical protein
MRTFLEMVQNSDFMASPYGREMSIIYLDGKQLLVSKLLDESVCINIQNVFDYVVPINNKQSTWNNDDFPNIAPPFQTFFMEFKFVDGFRGGALFHYEKIESGWVASVFAFGEQNYGGKNITVPVPWAWRIISDQNGKMIEATLIKTDLNVIESDDNPDYYLTLYLFIPSLLAVSFMHCKNISLIENEPKKNGSGRNRNRYGPKITFKTLLIKPMKKVLETEGDIHHNGLKKALHICRGHFKTYEDGKGLFGRYPGTYWWSDQVRGKIENGIVEKDYSVGVNK